MNTTKYNNYNIELFAEYEVVSFYSVKYCGENFTEMEKFLAEYSSIPKFKQDIAIITKWLSVISRKGALERYFRPEGTYGSGVSAIPVEANKLRLYCLRISDSILIIGGGGVKDTRNWQASKTLSPIVELMIDVQKNISERLNNGTLRAIDNSLEGDLLFYKKKRRKK